jgi:hypothetical protein
MTAVEQMVTAKANRDIAWLRQALQSAVALEQSTLPLYTAAMLSLEVQNYPTYNAIRSVLMEEMVHMAIAANMLAAIGGTPNIRDLDPGYPRRGLPGGVEPDLEVGLARLSRPQLRNFMRLEAPFFLLPEQYRAESYPTIDQLYVAIKDAIADNAYAVRRAFAVGGPANQVGDNIGFSTFVPAPGADAVALLDAGIDEIIARGEGSTSGTIQAGTAYQNEESHYGKFAELWYGARYEPPDPAVPLSPATESQYFRGDPIPWPAVINTLAVPTDGYARILELDPDGPAVLASLQTFDAAYSGMLLSLHNMWNGPVEALWPTFGEAVKGMMELRVLSCFTMMRMEIPPAIIADLAELYPTEFAFLARYTDLNKPVFYGPRFRNVNLLPA